MRKVKEWSFVSILSTLLIGSDNVSSGPQVRRKLPLLVGLMLLGASLWAPTVLAQHTVTGEVTDAREGTTLPGVNIVVKGTQIGTTTRSDGTFTLEAPSPTDTLAFSFVGYQEKEVAIEQRSQISVTLQPAVTALEEVVVNVGYQEQAVETTTGSVSQVSGADLEIEPTTNLTQSLKGTLPGVFGVESTGRPGQDNVDLLIRGTSTLNNNDPLVVIDGVPGRQGGLARLAPSDIQSVSVVKDASASIYGARAANGVILVETKRGQSEETRVNVTVERGWSEPTTVPEMTDAPTYMQMLNELDQFRGTSPRFSQDEIDAHRGDLSDSYERHNTDWYAEALKDFSRQIEANASVSGGVQSLRYRVSLQGATEDGILVNSGTGFDQLGFRSNLDGDISENVSLAFDAHGRWENRELPSWTRGLNSAWEMLQRGKPTDPAFFPNGKPGPAQEEGVNPVVSERTGFQNDETYFIQTNANLDVNIPAVEGWSAKGVVAYDHRFDDFKQFQKPWTLYNFTGRDENDDPILSPVEVGVGDPRLNQSMGNTQDVLLRATSSYERLLFEAHNISALAGTEYQWTEGKEMEAFRRFFPTDQLPELFAGGQSQRSNTGTSFERKRLSFFGRFSYDYQQKYLLEFVSRYDGSFIFPEGNRYGFFPTVSAGWRLGQERWFNDFTGEFFDRLKLRASYGQVGNDQVNPFQFLRSFEFGDNQFPYGDGVEPQLVQTRVPNPSITWEVANKLDVGLEGAVLNERLTFGFTYFQEKREDILLTAGAAIPQTAGFSLPDQNIGEVNSWGVESQVQYAQNVSSKVSFRIGANLSWAKDEVEFIAEPEGQLQRQRAEGKPMNTPVVFIADGIWNTQEEIDNAEAHWPGARPGDVRFKDLNGDGTIDGDDRRRLDVNSQPDLIGSLNLGASVGQFDLRAQFQGAGRVHHNVFTSAQGEFGNYFQEFAENRWTPENKDASGPRAFNRDEPYWTSNMSTFWIRDAQYLRLKNARIGYTLPTGLSRRFSMDRLEMYLSGRNLVTFTPLEIGDPEVRAGGAQAYPPERQFTVGINLGF